MTTRYHGLVHGLHLVFPAPPCVNRRITSGSYESCAAAAAGSTLLCDTVYYVKLKPAPWHEVLTCDPLPPPHRLQLSLPLLLSCRLNRTGAQKAMRMLKYVTVVF